MLNTRELGEAEDQVAEKVWNKKIIWLPHTFESGPLLNLKREFRQLWATSYVYQGSVMKDVRLVMTTLSNPSLNDLLVRKKPSRLLLTRMEKLTTAEAVAAAAAAAEKKDECEQEL